MNEEMEFGLPYEAEEIVELLRKAGLAVLIEPQDLLEEEREQARINLGIVGIGESGAVYIPSVSDDGVLSWTNDKNLENPAPVNIKGEKGEQGLQGEKGDTGDPGVNGEDGFSPTIEVNLLADKITHNVQITDVNGTQNFEIQDGFSPTIETNYMPGDSDNNIPESYIIDITDKNGTQRVSVWNGYNGEDGYTPVKGTDYWTEEDKSEMVDDVLAALPTWTGGSY